jgi:hypothetical protein
MSQKWPESELEDIILVYGGADKNWFFLKA